MANKSVVRNAQYKRGGLNKRERHNERKNADYMNEDIIPERAACNVHFKRCEGSYEGTFDKMLADKTISTHGLGKDPHIVDELVFDVNTSYFESGGGYEYAKAFFEEAYRCAVQEIGGEQYILSAVMHADERNRALSEQLGRDVYHYHLHVVYVPVVQKELYFKKNNKNPELAGKLKEVITQVSHSKKWPRFKENGRYVNSYSLLQDRFFEHMRAAGYTDIERGERSSTAEHLTVLEYKTQQEEKRATSFEQKAEKKQKQLEVLDQKTVVAKAKAADFAEIDAMAKKTIGGNFQATPENWKTVSNFAKEGVKSRGIIKELRDKISALVKEIAGLKARLEQLGDGKQSITDTMQFHQAKRRAPKRLLDTIADILRKPPEQSASERTTPERKRSTGLEV